MSYIDEIINGAAKKHGIDPKLLHSFASIESGKRPGVRTGSYKGLFQLSEGEFRKYGGQGNIYDPVANADAAARKLTAESQRFQQKHGRAPSASDLYMVHQQGEGGAANHFANPDRPAWENMYRTGEGQQKGANWAKKAIWGNIPYDQRRKFGSVDNVTSRQFTNMWAAKVARHGGGEAPPVTERVLNPATGNFEDKPIASTPTEAPAFDPNYTPKIDIYQGERDTPVAQPQMAYPTSEAASTIPQDDIDDDVPGTSVTLPSYLGNNIGAETTERVESNPVDQPSPVELAAPLAPEAMQAPKQELQWKPLQEPKIVAPYVNIEQPDDVATAIVGRPVGTAEAYNNTLEEIAQNKSWWDRADAAMEINRPGDLVQQLYREADNLFQRTDPEFKMPEGELVNYPSHYHDLMYQAKNQMHYDALKADVDQRIEASKVLEGYTSWQVANFGVDMGVAVLAGTLSGGLPTIAKIREGVLAMDRLTTLGMYGAYGGAYSAADHALSVRAGNESNLALSVGLGIIGGVAFGGLSRASAAARKKVLQSADDLVRREADPEIQIAKGKTPTIVKDPEKPRDVAAEIEVLGEPMGTPIKPGTDVRVHRTATGGKLRAAVENFDEDMAVLNNLAPKLNPWGKTTKKVTEEAREIFNRQAHRLQETKVYYARVPEDKLGEVNDLLSKGLVKLESNVDDVISVSNAMKHGGKQSVIKVTVPKGSRVLHSDDLKWKDSGPPQVILGEGSLSLKGSKPKVGPWKRNNVTFNTKDGKELELSTYEVTHVPDKASGRSGGKEVLMRGNRGDDGMPLNAEQVLSHHAAEAGESSLPAASAGAAVPEVRVDTTHSPHILRTQTDRVDKMVQNAPSKGELYGAMFPKLKPKAEREAEGLAWYNPKAWGATYMPTLSNTMQKSDNPLENAIGPHLLYGGVDDTMGNLDKGVVNAPQSTYEIKEFVQQQLDSNLVRDWNSAFKEHVTELLKDKHSNPVALKVAVTKAMATDLKLADDFAADVSVFRRHAHLFPDSDKAKFIQKASAALDKYFDKYLEWAADPALVLGKPSGSIPPIAGMDIVKAQHALNKTKYLPRIYSIRQMQRMIEIHGNDVFYDYLLDNFSKTLAGSGIAHSKIVTLTKAFHDTIWKAKSGMELGTEAMSGNMDIDMFLGVLKHNGHDIGDDLEQALRDWTRIKKVDGEGSKAGSRTMFKSPLSDTHVMRPNEKYPQGIQLDDFTENNAIRMARAYGHSMSGYIALSHLHVPSADDPAKSIFGAIRNQRDLDRIIEDIGVAGLGKPGGAEAQKRIRTIFDMITGRDMTDSHISEENLARMRFVMALTTIRNMGKAGLNQITEMGNAVADGGIQVLQHFPMIRRMFEDIDNMRKIADKKNLKLFGDYLEHETGIGTHIERSSTSGRSGTSYFFGNEFLEEGKWTRLAQKGVRGTLVGSGMIPLTAQSQKAVFSSNLTRLAHAARKAGGDFDKLPPRLKRKLVAMGIEEGPRSERLIQMLGNKDIFIPNVESMFGKIDYINHTHEGFDAEMMQALTIGLRRTATRTIQESKPGASHPALNGAGAQMFLQFKNYTVQAVTQQHVQRVRQVAGSLKQAGKAAMDGEGALFNDAMASLAEPAAAYAVQGALALATYRVYLAMEGLGMSDGEYQKLLDERWNKEGALVGAIVARSGPTGWIPTVWNSTMGAATGTTFGDARTSGLSNTFVPPSVQSAYSSLQAAGKLVQAGARSDKEFSDKDARGLGRAVTNFWVVDALNGVMSQMLFPDHQPGR